MPLIRAILVVVLLGFLTSANLAPAGEFAVVNETVTWTESRGGFFLWQDLNKGPTNWVSPDNYLKGQFHIRFEVIQQPTKEKLHLSFCFWGNPAPGQPSANRPETASPISDALLGPGSVATFSSSPSTWWQHETHGGVDFKDRSGFWRWGLPSWVSKSPNVLLGLSPEHWSQRAKWLPLKLKVTVVAVSQGATFSGWTNYIGPATSILGSDRTPSLQ